MKCESTSIGKTGLENASARRDNRSTTQHKRQLCHLQYDTLNNARRECITKFADRGITLHTQTAGTLNLKC